MPYQVNVFKNWPTFATWDDLKVWLESADGGKLRVVEPKDGDLVLVRYVKGQSDFTKVHTKWCRSVVVNKKTRLPVCVAPPKAEQLTASTLDSAVVAEEFVDGTMVNLFMEKDASTPTLATRSRIGADTKFYGRNVSFADMFQEALTTLKFGKVADLLPSAESWSSVFTSTVLQHPSNRIVTSIEKPHLVVVHQGTVAEDGTVFMEEDASKFVYSAASDETDVEVQPYTLASITAAKSVKDWVNTQSAKRGYGWQGLVLKDSNGNRWHQRSDVYETVRKLRGNESVTNERYARLRKSREVDQYLIFYPEDRDTFYELEGLFRKNTRQLSHFYVDVFRARKTAFHELPWPYKHHVSVLHNLYKEKLREQNKKVDLEQVIRYVNSLNYDDTVNMLKTHRLNVPATDEQQTNTA